MGNKEYLNAVVIGAGENVLGTVRGLYRIGIPSILIVKNDADISLRSRIPIQKLVVNYSSDQEIELLDSLFGLNVKRAVLLPCSDVAVGFVVRHADELTKKFDFCVPQPELARMLLDKGSELREMELLGVSVPRTITGLPANADEIVEKIRLPIIIKPSLSQFQSEFGAKNQIIYSKEELGDLIKTKRSILGKLIAQELIPGDDTNQWVCNCTFDRDSQLSSAFIFRRLGLAPAHRGVTSYALSEQNPELLQLVLQLGQQLRYVGPAMFEFKYDVRDKTYKYLEINPRIGLCNYFDTMCGVNNVYHSYCIAVGLPPKKVMPTQKCHRVFVNFFGDLFARREDKQPLFSILKTYMRHANKIHYGQYWSCSDPYPALVEFARGSKRVFRGFFKSTLGRYFR